jgi:hypothetical protein
MAKIALPILGALALSTTLWAQAPTPATQPVRPPERPTGEPTTPLPAPEPDFGDTRRKGSNSSGEGEPDASTTTLKGCLQAVASRGFRLHPVEGDDATVTQDVRLGGEIERLREHLGRIVEVRGTYEQDTPATQTTALFRVDRVKALAGTCPAR